jgi:ATP-dependent RNA helicase DeaD
MLNFYELKIDPTIISALSNMGFEEPTPIQEMTIPLAMMGRDVIGQAQTGTGKTAAYGIPLVDKCQPEQQQIQGLVIVPTRELAMQVAEELNKIGTQKKIRSLPIYGGQEMERQIRALKKRPQIIVGTPGRLMDHLRRRTIRLDRISLLVLDEADEMLNMGFKEDIEEILRHAPQERQNLLFSATMPLHTQNLTREFMQNPEMVHINPRAVTVINTEQQYIEVPETKKLDVLCRLLDILNPDMAIVFGRTKRRVDEIAEALSKRGYSADGIHGDLTQSQRDTVMRNFKAGTIDILVATDVAARGLDISGVTHIYNFDIPQDAEWYVHRIGRTGRAGENGLAITFVTSREISHLKYIEASIKHKISRKPIPTPSDALAGLQQTVVNNLLEVAGQAEIQAYRALAEGLLDEYDSETLLAAALKIMTREPEEKPLPILTEAPPIHVKRIRTPKKINSGYRRAGRPPQKKNHSRTPKHSC